MKPITVARQEFMDELAELINQSGLPAFVVGDVMRSCLAMVDQLAVKQYNKDKEEWDNDES